MNEISLHGSVKGDDSSGTYDKAFAKGARAFTAGRLLSSNPFKGDGIRKHGWIAGWEWKKNGGAK